MHHHIERRDYNDCKHNCGYEGEGSNDNRFIKELEYNPATHRTKYLTNTNFFSTPHRLRRRYIHKVHTRDQQQKHAKTNNDIHHIDQSSGRMSIRKIIIQMKSA